MPAELGVCVGVGLADNGMQETLPMSVNDTINQAMTSPNGGLAASDTSVNNAMLMGIQTGDTTTARQLGALGSQSMEAEKLLSSLSGMGGHVDLKA